MEIVGDTGATSPVSCDLLPSGCGGVTMLSMATGGGQAPAASRAPPSGRASARSRLAQIVPQRHNAAVGQDVRSLRVVAELRVEAPRRR